jgi:protein-serine/threonine kinase
MLAGYLPFDDDPANPEGDNINLLYRYIVSTPLIFPDYVTPHARDLLKRILVPDPRKRADLFEIARHSWLSEFSHVISLITSSTTTSNDITNTTVPSSGTNDVPSLARSASVREPTTKSHANRPTAVGALAEKTARIEQTPEAEKPKTSRDTKRRTVQVEYVAPQSPTRTESSPGKTRARTEAAGPVQVAPQDTYQRTAASSSYVSPPAPRPVREQQRAISDNVLANVGGAYAQRPSTGGSMTAGGAPAVVAKDQAQGRISQPPRAAPYPEAAPQPDRRSYMHRDSSSADHSQIGFPQTVATSAVTGPVQARLSRPERGHRRSSTLSGLTERLGFGKRGSLFGGRSSGSEDVESGPDGLAEKPKRGGRKIHPPVSMARPMPNDNAAAVSGGASMAPGNAEPRKSTDSRRTSFSFSRRSNRDKDGDAGAPPPSRSSRRFSLLPSFVRGGNKDDRDGEGRPPSSKRASATPAARDQRPRMAFGQGVSRSPSGSTTDSAQDPIPLLYDSALDGPSPPVWAPQPQQQHSRSASLNQPRHYQPQPPTSNPTSNPSSAQVLARKPVGSGNTPPDGSPPMQQSSQQPRSSGNNLQPYHNPYAPAHTPGPNGEALMQHNVFYPSAGGSGSQVSETAPVIGLAQLRQQQHHHQQQHQQQQREREPATSFQQLLPPEMQLQRDEEQQQQQQTREKPSVLHKRRGFNEAFDNDGGHAGSSGAARRVMAMFNWKRRTRTGPSVA